MRHVQLPIARLGIGRRSFDLRLGTLTVVRRDNAEALDWEVLIHTLQPEPVAASTHELSMEVIVGADDDGGLMVVPYEGLAALVRRVDHAVVFRGAGILTGFDEALLAPLPD